MKQVMTFMAATVALTACAHAGLPVGKTASKPANAHAQSANQSLATGWYGPGWDGGVGYFNPSRTPEYDPYPYYNIVGGETYGLVYTYSLPSQFESPYNPAAALTHHGVSGNHLELRPGVLSLRKPVAQVVQPLNVAPN